MAGRGKLVRLGRAAAILFGLLLAVPLCYGLTALSFSLFPVGGESQAADGVEIFVASNGIHTDLILPALSDAMDWSLEFGPSDFPDGKPIDGYLAFGWGDRGFYLETPNWSDLKLSTALSALFGSGGTVLHVFHIGRPALGEAVKSFRVSPAQLATLTRHVIASFRRDEAGRLIAIPGAHYARNDAFFEATGRYGPFTTCNEWVARGLRQSGLPAARWSPFPLGVMVSKQ
jgi:uncharacterized protein (TIGR02117 family)